MNNTKLVSPGDKLDIYKPDSSDSTGAVYKSSISDMLADNIWEITMPVDGGRIVLFQIGMPFDFVLYTKGKSIFKCSAIVRRRYRKDSLFFLAIELVSNLEKVQRRQFFRLQCTLDIDYSRLEYDSSVYLSEADFCNKIYSKDYEKDYLTSSMHSVILDISGGGIRISTDTPLEAGSYIITRFRLPVNGLEQEFILIGQVIECERSQSQSGKYFARIKFIFDNIAKREQIVRYVFEEERRIRRREME